MILCRRNTLANYDTLNEQQRAAVFQTEGPVLILAGAGSGKTRVLTHRAAYLIEEKGVNPWHILAITFTNKAAGEMRERIDDLVGFGSESIWVSTFHSACVRILRRHIDRLGYDNNFTIYDADDQKTVMKEICKRLQIDTKMYKEKTFLHVISAAKDNLVSPEEFTLQAGSDYKRQKQAQVYREYQQTLKKNNALDFDDLIVKCVELLQNDDEVLDNYQERFRYIMVDEYQDTNTAQFHLIRLLAGKYQNLCVVGDDDQSIYKFRGANINNILHFERYFPDAAVIKLEENYRSTQNILDAANAVIRNNLSRKSKALWTQKDAGDKIIFRQLDTAYEEAETIAFSIQSFVRKGTYTYGDCAVLYRTNAQSRLLEERFVRENIPYRIFGGVNFYARREIKDLLAYLKTVDNASDDLAVRRIINVPKRGIGATTIGRVQEYADENGLSFYEALKRTEDIPAIKRAAASKIQPFVTFIQTMRSKQPYLSIEMLMQEILDTTGYLADLEAEDTEESRSRIENIEELISKIAAFEEAEDKPTLGGFLEEVALVADIDNLEEDSDYVVLMTLHSAKGLEFPNVYLSGMEDGLFPGYITITADDPAEIEEERRLCYVGITRAKEHLTLTGAKMRMIRGETQFSKTSRFVKEIPKNLLSGYIPDRKDRMSQKSYGEPGYAYTSSPYEQSGTGGMPYATSSSEQSGAAGRAYASATSGQPGNFMKPYASPIVKQFGSAGRLTSLDYAEGDRVSHMKFGEGTVTGIVSGGRDFEVSVDFDKFGTKKMFASFAKLRKLC
ncbi:MAG: DNA helicase PcrA [Clostridiales bacterium]|nr:DNA helicase PcrA [Clostridiales bacterium]